MRSEQAKRLCRDQSGAPGARVLSTFSSAVRERRCFFSLINRSSRI